MLYLSARPRWNFAWSMALALGLHGLLIMLLLLVSTSRRLVREQIDSVSVEIVTQTSQPLVVPDPAAAESPYQGTLPYPAVPAIPDPPGLVGTALPPARDRPGINKELQAVTRFYSASALAEPRNSQARAALGQLSGDERAIQICNLEAMEQAARQRKSLHPDFVVAYATADVLVVDDLVVAKGAALRNRPDWIALRYRCRVSPDRNSVVAFSFALDAAIPSSLRQELPLPSGSGSD